MPIAISYIRFSDKKQMRGDSLRRQLALTEDYCKRNNLVLDDSFRLRDLGVSGFHGNNVRNGALAGFLAGVKRLPPGTVLIIEHVDRLGRDQAMDALQVVRDILYAGVDIVTLAPERRYSRDNCNDMGVLFELVMYLVQAYEYSANLSRRIKASWASRRKEVRDGTRKVIKKVEPFWIGTKDGEFFLNEHADLVRQMFAWCNEGNGTNVIARRLNDMGVKTPRLNRKWNAVLVSRVLTGRHAVGEYQPGQWVDDNRVLDGPPIPNYYPAVVSEETFYAAQNAIALRRKCGRGRRSIDTRNIFQGLIINGFDHQPLYYYKDRYRSKHGDIWTRRMASKGHLYKHTDAQPVTIHYDPLESAFLRCVEELDPRHFASAPGESTNRIAVLSGQLVEIDHKVETIEREIKGAKPDQIKPFLKLLADFATEREGIKEELDRLRAEESNHATATVSGVQSLAKMLTLASEEEAVALRNKIRQHLKMLVRSVVVYPKAKPMKGRRNQYECAVTVEFHNGLKRWFRFDQDGQVTLNVRMPKWLKEALDEPDED